MGRKKRSVRSSSKSNKPFWSWLSWSWNIVIFVSVIVGLGSIFSFLPRLDVSPGPDYAYVTNPIDASLSLTNNGYFTITVDNVSTLIYDLVAEGGTTVTGLTFVYKGNSTLRRGESSDFTPIEMPIWEREPHTPLHVVRADFLVITKYRQWGWPVAVEKRIRFNAKRRGDGSWIWYRPSLTSMDRVINPSTRVEYKPNEKSPP